MTDTMNISASAYAPALLTLPWNTPLEDWDDNTVVKLPKGISRHTVRFVQLNTEYGSTNATRITNGSTTAIIAAVKEIGRHTAHHEYAMLRELKRIGAPAVTPIAVITGRRDTSDDILTAALVTEHLRFSLPYREIFTRDLPEETPEKLIKALAILLVKLHLNNFYWGDVSLSNTLFRRDADTFSAYLVDAETGEFQPQLSQQRREYDVEIARINIIGELMDLSSGGKLSPNIDPISLGNLIQSTYEDLWHELTAEEMIKMDENWKLQNRLDKLAEMGFDVGELSLSSGGENTVTVRPVIVDPGHHHKQVFNLLGLDVEEQQARRILNEIQQYEQQHPDHTTEQAARMWFNEEYLPTISAIPAELTEKLEPAQIFHEILDHRYYLSQERASYIPMEEAAQSYFHKVLPEHRDEAIILLKDEKTTPTVEGQS
ncbi:DUF4032 domain-containing protein [Corynebacterium sp. HS2168-gen11]|uniref:DUF4032 domain-containing protein n=1 Tax=Corynebacterium sp. HS2168-gen11 TaxID=2974027 RepID=UPI00216B2835|nr:DUF4032 domain-containing protein [Corynebacterium sp. HS2168-gen11]MCS4535723.1 DUF4032 domain-containing protein [Corynebacterium sp. HS2168-gen11]